MAFIPAVLPIDPRDAVVVLQEQLEQIAREFDEYQRIEVWHIAPPNPRIGQIVRADGSDWNPGGGGAGWYGWDGSTWRLFTVT